MLVTYARLEPTADVPRQRRGRRGRARPRARRSSTTRSRSSAIGDRCRSRVDRLRAAGAAVGLDGSACSLRRSARSVPCVVDQDDLDARAGQPRCRPPGSALAPCSSSPRAAAAGSAHAGLRRGDGLRVALARRRSCCSRSRGSSRRRASTRPDPILADEPCPPDEQPAMSAARSTSGIHHGTDGVLLRARRRSR